MLQSEIDRFLLSKQSAMLSEATTDWYAVQLRMFNDWLRSSSCTAVTTETIERYLVYLRRRTAKHSSQPLSPSSVAGAYRALKIFYKWCVDRGIVTASPLLTVKMKKPAKKPPRRATRQEFDDLVRSIPVDDWVGLRDYLLIHTVFYCGLRIGEALRLEAIHCKLTPCLKAGALSLALRTILCAHPRCVARLRGPTPILWCSELRNNVSTLNILHTGRLPGATAHIQLCVQVAVFSVRGAECL